MNIFFRELKAHRKALIIWCVCMALLILSGMGKYTAYSAGNTSVNVFNEMPKSLKAALGMGSLDVTTMSGYFAMLFIYIELTAAIHAVLLGNGIVAKEERDKTAEFLMTKPVSRRTIIISKLLAALVNVLILNIVTLLSSLPMVSAYNKGPDITGEIVTFILSMLLVQLIFMAIGAMLAAVTKRPKASGSIGTGILVAGYVIARVTDFSDKISALNILSPFKYFDVSRIVAGDGLSVVIVLLSLLLIVALSIGSCFFYVRRDLRI